MWITFYLAISSVVLHASAALSNFKEGLCAPPNTLYITGLLQKCTTDMDCSDNLKCCTSKSQLKVCAPPQPAFTACQHQRASAVEIARIIDSSINFIPECIETDGSFAPVQCSEQKGRCWCVDQSGFEIPGTRAPIGLAPNCSAPRVCPNPECRMLCPQSFVMQKDGCPVCKCYDACEDIMCPRSTKCITDSVKCVNEPCPPISKCAARAIDDVDCPNGLPALVDVNKKDYFLCSLLDSVKASKCPSGFDCNVRPNKEFGVCCPQAKENVVKAGQCPPLKKNDKSCVVECRVDQDCYGASKCCSDNCTALCLSPLVPTLCQAQRAGTARIPGVFSPTCEEDGQFTKVQCSGQKCWCVDSVTGSEITGTRKVDGSLPDCSAPARCANLKCDLQCDHGYKMDADGCPICSCYLPCEDLGCPNDCNLMELDCGTPPCPILPSCKESRKLDYPCIYGPPARDNRTRDYTLCGDLANMSLCPDNYKCEPIDAEGHGMCCPLHSAQRSKQIPIIEENAKPIDHIGKCPAVSSGSLDKQSCGPPCTKDRECADSEKCCENQCGLVCVKAITKTSCQVKADSLAAVTSSADVPSIRCDAKGGYHQIQCNRQKCWCTDNLGNEMPGTRTSVLLNVTIDCSKPRQCNPECRMLCPFGFIYDEEGCPACDCINPCDGIICPSGTECQVQGTECVKEPCPFVPKCITKQPMLNPCAFGIPLKNPFFNTTVICGQLAGQIECPATHECISIPNQAPVCCERESLDVCRFPKDPGPCRAAIKRWHFSKTTRQCEEFLYGGCDGNPNNFPSQAVCEKMCGAGTVAEPSQAHCPVPLMDGSAVCMNECSADEDCPGASMCCSNGCGRICTEGVFQTACDIQKIAYTRMSRFAKELFKDHIYIPDCHPDGAFDKMQCDGKKEICWCVNENGQEIDGTRKPYHQNMSCRSTDGRVCENTMMCRMDCPLGFVKNLTDGCPICDCVDPCELYDCPDHQECKVIELKSVENIISRFPICSPLNPPPVSCPFGMPLKIVESNRIHICFNDSACPSTHSCSVTKGSRTGVCCSKTATACLLNTEVGPCRGTIPRWAFDPISQSCKLFSYGGCQGNGNNFATRADCENICAPTFTVAENTSIMVVPQDPRAEGHVTSSDFCLIGTPISPVVGSETLNSSLERCLEGIACPLTHFCSSHNNRVMCCPKTSDDCFLPVISGQCTLDVSRFYFDPTTKSCIQFQYSGCGANGNNFASEAQCRSLCPVMTDCESQRQVALFQQRSSQVPIFVPECDEFDGSWLPVQCQPATGLCWCVDNKGHADMYTAVRGYPKCAELVVASNVSTEVCDEGEVLQFCDPNLCRHQACLGNPRANCRINPCGGCSIDFYNNNNEKVDCYEGLTECQREFLATMRSPNWAKLAIPPPLMAPGTKSSFNGAKIIQIYASTNESLPLKLGFCPPYFALPSEGCAIECRDDSQCTSDQKCCFAGCGYVCVPSLPISTVKPGQCPVPEIRQPLHDSSCTSECNSDSDCPDSKKCCGKGSCGGFSCVEPIVNRILLPLYLPTCDIQGNYEWTQCSGEVCWCEYRNGTTKPETITRGQIQCNESGIIAGTLHQVCRSGEQALVCKDACRKAICKSNPNAFCVADPCNKCAVEFVDQQGKTVSCEDACVQKMEPGSCSTEPSERFFFNHYTQECNVFNYSGCGGNENNFISQEQCMQRCLPKDICMQEPSTGPCRALIERWHFNRISGQCEKFDYGGCQGNSNNFLTKAACETRCPQTLICPKISSSAILSTCNRSGICDHAKCAHPLAICIVDPCTCQAVFVDKWARKLQCDSLPTKCHNEAMERSVMADIYHPQCQDNGKYKPLQCFADHFSEKCWCVDEAGNTIDDEHFAVGERQCLPVPVEAVQITMRFALDQLLTNSTENLVREKLSSIVNNLTKDSLLESLLLVPMKHSVLATMILRGERAADVSYFFEKMINVTPSELHLLQLQTNLDRSSLNVVPSDRSLLPEDTTLHDSPVEARSQDLLPLLSILAVVLIIVAIIAFFVYRKRRTGSYTNRQPTSNPDVEKTTELPVKTLPNDYVSIPFVKKPAERIYENSVQN